MFVSFTWSLEFWPTKARRQSSNGDISWTIRPQTSHHPTTNTLIPEKELEVLQLGAHKVLLPLLFDLQHRFEAAEVIGIAKLFFPKPQQHCNQSTSLVHSPPPPTPLKALGIAGLATHGRKQADSRRFCWPNTEFCSILAVSYPWWSIIPICETASAEPNSESCSTETGKTLCKSLFFWEAEHWTKTRLINVPHQNKVWQAISYFGHTCFAANTSIDRLDVLRKGPRLTVTSGVTIIMTDYRSSWLNGQPPAKRRKTKIWLTIAHSVNNFIRSELPASKSDMAPRDIGKRRKNVTKNGEPFFTTLHSHWYLEERFWPNCNRNYKPKYTKHT